jgi:O-antigen/teichoic acid export membrane protein
MAEKKRTLYKILGENAISNGLFFGVERIIQLISFAVLVRILSLEEYGLLLIGGTLIGQFAFLDGGLSIAIQKFIPEFRLNEQKQDIGRAITITLFFFLGLAVLPVFCF